MNEQEYERMYRVEDSYWWFLARRRLILSLMSARYGERKDLRVLDIGCGTGAMLREMSEFGCVVGADYSSSALAFCGARGSRNLSQADIRRLPFASNSFDSVTAMDVIEHIDDDKAAAGEILRVLRPGGRLFATVPAYRFLWSEHDEALHHYRRYTASSFQDILRRSGFETELLSYSISALFPLIAAFRVVSKLIPRPEGQEKNAHVVPVSPGVNRALLALCNWETRLLIQRPLPFGVSVACVAIKPER